MLYSETELKKRLKSGCPVFYFYASDEALVRSAAAKAEKFLSEEAPDTTTLDGPTPSVEDIVLAAGTISFFGGRRLVMLPLIRPSAYSDKDLQELCDTLSDTENAVFVLTSLLEEKYGKIKPGKREQKLIASCEKLGYCVQLNRPTGAALQAMARDWAKEAGADSLWYKDSTQKRLMDVVRQTLAGEHIFPNAPPTVEIGMAKSTEFTKTELKVLRHLLRGLSYTRIAAEMGCEMSTVKFHVSNMLQKTGLENKLQLALAVSDVKLIADLAEE